MTITHGLFSFPRPSRFSSYVSARLRSLDIEISTVHAILSQYGLELLEAPRNLATGRRNRNVLVETSAGTKVLKGYRPQWQVGTAEYAHSILEQLAEMNFPAPRLVDTLSGKTYCSHAGHIYGLFDFADGANYTANFLLRAHRLRLMAVIGRTLAAFHRQLKGFMPSGHHHLGFISYTGPRRRDLVWHADKLHELKERSSQLTEPEARGHAEWLVQHSGALLDELGRLDEKLSTISLPRLIIHGDYGLHNVLFCKDDTALPVDFELARLEWRLSDLVSCLSRFRYANGTYDLESMRWFMQGYQAEYPIDVDEWQAWPQVWQFYKLQGAVQYWNSFFETDGPTRKLISARDAVSQAEWARTDPVSLLEINIGATRSEAIDSY